MPLTGQDASLQLSGGQGIKMKLACILLAFATAETLAAPVEGLYAIEHRGSNTLYHIDTQTGSSTLVAEIGLVYVIGLGSVADTDRLYALGCDALDRWGVFEVDPNSGDAAFVQEAHAIGGSVFSGFAVARDDDFYLVDIDTFPDSQEVYRYNLNVPGRTFVADIPSESDAFGFAASFDPTTGSVWFADRLQGLYRELDPDTGVITPRFNPGLGLFGVGAIAFDDEGRLFGSARSTGSAIYQYDASDGHIVGFLQTGLDDLYSMTYIVPAPSSLALLAALPLATARRRR